MGISIPEEKITDSLIEHLNDAGRSETTINVKSTMKSRIEIFCNVLIAHGIVSPPVDVELNDDGSIRRDTHGVPIIAPAGTTSSMWHSMHWRGEQ